MIVEAAVLVWRLRLEGATTPAREAESIAMPFQLFSPTW
jgi:hypothetical protein